MDRSLIVYEDAGWQRFLPLVYIRPVWALICGMGDLLSKLWSLNTGSSWVFWCRPQLAASLAEERNVIVNQLLSEPALLLNGRGIWHCLPTWEHGPDAWVGTVGDDQQIACIFADLALAQRLSPVLLLNESDTVTALEGVPRRDISACVDLLDWPWQLIHAHGTALERDWQQQKGSSGNYGHVDNGSYILSPEAVHIGARTRIKPGSVIDAETGPVWIGEEVCILPHTYIQGPAYIGSKTLVQAHTTLREGSYIGPFCKVGGELENTIIHGYSNKQHDGFLGHSYVGQWTNIAAGCTNSDLKNTYGSVRVPINGDPVDSGEVFMGMLMGDHSKLGINIAVPTGAVIGFCSSIFTPSCPRFVASFSWCSEAGIQAYDTKKGLQLARKVMARRNVQMSPATAALFSSIAGASRIIEKTI